MLPNRSPIVVTPIFRVEVQTAYDRGVDVFDGDGASTRKERIKNLPDRWSGG
jgi:hypothetical protein